VPGAGAGDLPPVAAIDGVPGRVLVDLIDVLVSCPYRIEGPAHSAGMLPLPCLESRPGVDLLDVLEDGCICQDRTESFKRRTVMMMI